MLNIYLATKLKNKWWYKQFEQPTQFSLYDQEENAGSLGDDGTIHSQDNQSRGLYGTFPQETL
jgi:hypothetical protein